MQPTNIIYKSQLIEAKHPGYIYKIMYQKIPRNDEENFSIYFYLYHRNVPSCTCTCVNFMTDKIVILYIQKYYF